MKKCKKLEAWASVGSHGGVYVFMCGPVADRYPELLHVYKTKVTPDLQPVTITYGHKKPRIARG